MPVSCAVASGPHSQRHLSPSTFKYFNLHESQYPGREQAGRFSRSQFESEHLLKPLFPPTPLFFLQQVHEHNHYGQVEFIYRAAFLGCGGVQIHQSAGLRLLNMIAVCFIQRLHFIHSHTHQSCSCTCHDRTVFGSCKVAELSFGFSIGRNIPCRERAKKIPGMYLRKSTVTLTYSLTAG